MGLDDRISFEEQERAVTDSFRGRGITRRQFAALTASALGSFTLVEACGGSEAVADDGRIAARPKTGARVSESGMHALAFGDKRDATIQVPPGAGDAPLPLLVLLHGAGGSAAGILRRLGKAADEAGVAVLAPDSRGTTWDAIEGNYGRDVVFLNRALERVFDTVAVDPRRIAIGGFSDGASYAVSLGLINGDLFAKIAAFSPGFIVPRQPHGRPRVFISHGTEDQILPYDQCGRRIASDLERLQYDVTFRDFRGGHEIPADIAAAGMKWLAEPVS
jgi:predicted esterase